MPMSTENDTFDIALVRDHFAYRMEDSIFWQSEDEGLHI